MTTPHSIEAEKVALGAVLVQPSKWHDLAAVVTGGDFFRAAHREIFGAMNRLVAAGRAVDALTVKQELSKAGVLDECGGPAYLIGLTDGVPSGSNVTSYAETIRELATRRNVIKYCGELIAEAHEQDEPIDKAIGRGVRALADMSRSHEGLVTDAQASSAYIEALSSGVEMVQVQTGYADFDHLTGGLRPGELVIVAARPSVGKSSWALGVCEDMARRGDDSFFGSLEMTSRSLAERLVCWRSGVEASVLQSGDATPGDYEKVMNAVSAERSASIWIHEKARTLTEISAWAQQVKGRRGIKVVVVDYLQLIVSERRFDSRQTEVSAISRGLKMLAQDLKVPVVALSQLSRAPEDRRDKRPQIFDLRESGALEQDADLVVLLFREEMHKATDENRGVAEVIVAKNRRGKTGTVKMQFEARLAQFRDLARP